MPWQSYVDRRPDLPALVLTALTLVVFGRIVFQGWVEFDDPIHVLENPALIPVTWESVKGMWQGPYRHLFIPLSYTLYALEAVVARWLAGVEPNSPPPAVVFHLTSLVLHTAAVITVQRLLVRLVRNQWAATVGAAVFAVHPLQVETVAWVSEQRGLLAGLLSLVALEQFLRWQEAPAAGPASKAYGLGPLAAFVGALLAKPTSITVPVIAFLIARERPTRGWQAMLAALGPWFVCAGVAACVTRLVQPARLSVEAVALPARLVVAADAVGFYLAKVFVPWNLCVAYGRTPAVVLADPTTPFVVALVAGLAATISLVPALRRWRLPAILFVVPLLPVLGLTPFVFQNQSTVADRYAYLAMLGPALAVADAVGRTATGQRSVRAVSLIAVACLAGLSFRQVGTWADTGTLAAHACRVAPGVTGSWTLLGAHQRALGDARSAVVSARRALAIDHRNRIARLDLAAALVRVGDGNAADHVIAELQTHGLSRSEIATIFYNRGCTNMLAGALDEATIDFRMALRIDPDHPRAAENLGVVLARQRRFEEAERVFRDRLDTVDGEAAR